MQTLVRQLGAVLAVALTVSVLVHPVVAFAHAVEHLEQDLAGEPSGEAPSGDRQDGGQCDRCLSLSQGRMALGSTGSLAEPIPPSVEGGPTSIPLPVPSRVRCAPESPRAPPLG